MRPLRARLNGTARTARLSVYGPDPRWSSVNLRRNESPVDAFSGAATSKVAVWPRDIFLVRALTSRRVRSRQKERDSRVRELY